MIDLVVQQVSGSQRMCLGGVCAVAGTRRSFGPVYKQRRVRG